MKKTKKSPVSKIDFNQYPKGYSASKVRKLAKFYDSQPDDQAIAEAEAAYNSIRSSMVEIPIELMPKVNRLLLTRQA